MTEVVIIGTGPGRTRLRKSAGVPVLALAAWFVIGGYAEVFPGEARDRCTKPVSERQPELHG